MVPECPLGFLYSLVITKCSRPTTKPSNRVPGLDSETISWRTEPGVCHYSPSDAV